jgi:hypothetical protein
MTCEEALARLDEFVDGELEEAEFQEIELHLAACGTCAQEARELRALVEQAAGLPRARAPERDLWPSIAARLQSPTVTRARVNHLWAWGALAAAAALVLSVLLWRGNGRLPTLTPGNAAQLTSFQADRDYERAATELLAAVATRRERLTPEAQARVDESLRVIAQALTAIRSELAKDPGSPALNHLLLSVHQRRIEVLRTLVNLTA